MATKWRHMSKLGWGMAKNFFNIIYSYYRVISYILFVGKNKVNRVKRPYICSNWPKMAKMASFWPQNDVICRNWGEVWQKIFFQHYLLLLLSHLIYTFLGVKMELNGSKSWNYISYIKCLLNVYFTKTSLTTPVPPLFRGQTKVFPNLQTHMLLTKPV